MRSFLTKIRGTDAPEDHSDSISAHPGPECPLEVWAPLFATLVTTAMIFGFGGLLIRTLGHAL
jgi:hypothetical protein